MKKRNNYKMYDNMPFLYYEEETSACLLCGEEIDYDKTLCRDCWEEAREDFENAFKRPPKGRDIIKCYDKALKEGLHNKKADIEEIEEELAMLAVGYYYTAEFPENGKELLNRITDDFEELERKTGKTTRGSTVDERINQKKYPATHHCEDGHYVRSRAEQLIDNWLYHHGYLHAYEVKLRNGDQEYHPDFYLKKEDIYIEYWGMDDPYYKKVKKEKLAFYKKQGYKLISIEADEIEDIDDILEKRIYNLSK